MNRAERLSRAVDGRPGPLAVVDLDAFDANAATLAAQAHGLPVRLATKSVRCRTLIDRALAAPGFAGLMCYSAAEAAWLAGEGARDVLLAYPSVDAAVLATVAGSPPLRQAITIMADSIEYLDWLAATVPGASRLRLALDVDASLRLAGGHVHLGVRRSALRTAQEVLTVVRHARGLGHEVVGLMFYDAQIAGLQDTSAAVRMVKRRSHAELLERRRTVVTAVRAEADLTIVNGGGTGSLTVTGEDSSLTELAAGSGLYAPTLFDGYDGLQLEPALFVATQVVRRPDRDIVTTYGGGYIASGPAGRSRVLQPLPEQRLSLIRTEGTGEVQTPLRGPGARHLSIGDTVWFRPAKAGEVTEHFTELHLVQSGQVIATVPTYRGEGHGFG